MGYGHFVLPSVSVHVHVRFQPVEHGLPPMYRSLFKRKEWSMPAKQFQFHANAGQSILRGARVLADAVRVTLGPKSKCVLIERKFGDRLSATLRSP